MPESYFNSLLNELILEKILENLTFLELKELRAVCTFWNNLITNSFLKRRSLIKLDNDEKLEDFVKHDLTTFESFSIKFGALTTFETISSFFSSSVAFNLKTIRIELVNFPNMSKIFDKLIFELNSLQHLKILVLQSPASEQLQSLKTRSEIFPCYNLSSFSYVNLTTLSELGPSFQSPIKFCDILKRFPNIKELSMVNATEEEINGFTKGLQYLDFDLNLEKLEILDENSCPSTPSNDQLQSLASASETQLKNLAELHLEVAYNCDFNILASFLEKLTKSLRTLKLRKFPLNQNQLQAENLLFNISGNSITTLEISQDFVFSLNCLQKFSNLATLRVIIRDYSRLNVSHLLENTNTNILLAKLKNVTIEPPLISGGCVRKLLSICPKLQKLRLRMDNEMLRALCATNNFGELEELFVISWDGLTDEGFLDIGNIKSLKSLTIEVWPDYHNHISDLVVFYGLAELKRLTKFIAIRTEITEQAMESMIEENNYRLFYRLWN